MHSELETDEKPDKSKACECLNRICLFDLFSLGPLFFLQAQHTALHLARCRHR
jgi:hypothetical protein